MNQIPVESKCFIDGERIVLRGILPSDVNDAYHRWMNDPEVTRFLESRFQPHSPESLRAYVLQKQEDRDTLFLAIVIKDGTRHIGNIKLGPIDWHHRLADVGIIIGEKDCWGRGYATDAVRMLSTFAFQTLNLHKLTAGCYDSNGGSAKAFQKAGWVVEGRRRAHYYCEGRYVDAIMMALIRQEPGALKTNG